MRIGSLKLQLARPENLDELLLAMTGCSAEETCAHLRSPCIASTVAGALLPFIAGEKPVRHSLAEAIAAAGLDEVRRRVLELYEAAPAGEPAATRKGGTSGKGSP